MLYYAVVFSNIGLIIFASDSFNSALDHPAYGALGIILPLRKLSNIGTVVFLDNIALNYMRII